MTGACMVALGAGGAQLSVSIAPNDADVDLSNGVAYSQTFTATAVGGVGSKTYAWTLPVPGAGFSFSGGTTSASATVIRAGSTNVARGYTVRCTATDSAGSHVSSDVPVVVTWGVP